MSFLALSLMLVAAVDPALIGQWAGPGGFSLSLQPNGACVADGDAGTCRTQGGVLSITIDGETDAVRYTLSGGTLMIVDEDGAQIALSRVGGGRPATPSAPTPSPPTPSPPPPTGNPSARGPGSAFQQKAWGASFSVPSAWKAAEKDGLVLVGSDTEVGLIVVRFYPRISRAELEQGFHDNGMSAMPSSPLATFPARGGAALAGDLSGTDPQGNALAVRTVAVMTPHGGALVVAGLTTPPQFAAVKARADSLAASASFTKPPRASALAGDYVYSYVSSDGRYSRESRVTLCQGGSFTRSGEMAGSGDSGQAFVGSRNSGTWSASGDGSGGTLTLTYGDGTSESFPYSVSTRPQDMGGYGPAVDVGGTLYQKSGPGGC